jgi:alpha-ribazole phosphatase
LCVRRHLVEDAARRNHAINPLRRQSGMSIYLVRHTAPHVKRGVCYGDSNVPVHEEEFARVMPDITAALPGTALVISSPLSRCRRLADFLHHDSASREVCIDERLRERSLGDWQGKSWADISREETDAWNDDYLNHAPPNGESIGSMRQRVVAAFESAWELAAGRHLVLVTHAGPIACIIANWRREVLATGLRPSARCGDVLRLDGGASPSVAFVRRAKPIDDEFDFVI